MGIERPKDIINSNYHNDSGEYVCLGCLRDADHNNRMNPNRIHVSSNMSKHTETRHQYCKQCGIKFSVIANSDGTGLRVSEGWH